VRSTSSRGVGEKTVGLDSAAVAIMTESASEKSVSCLLRIRINDDYQSQLERVWHPRN
jgi:hypothetical protein